ncbi:MAG: DNA repair protein RecN [Bdellovibrionales bacterium]
MLTRLVIQDVVLIDKLALEPGSGLNVFTGETGAGKSIVLDALGLALGERGEAGLIRSGAPFAAVTAEFSLSERHPVFALAEEQGLAVENPLILRRSVQRDGKSRAFVNDQPVGIALLRRFGECLLEVHGQFEARGLLNPVTHREVLDGFAGAEALRARVEKAYSVWKGAEDRLREAVALRDRSHDEIAFLTAAVEELERLAPQAGEEAKLAERRVALQHRGKILESLQTAERALEGERGAVAVLAQAGKAVARAVDKAPHLAELLAQIDRAADEAAEAAQRVARELSSVDQDPEALVLLEERLFALRAAARKHSVPVEALPEARLRLEGRLAMLTDGGYSLKALAAQVAATKAAWRELAEALGAARRSAALKLEKALAKEMSPLKLERAKFVVDIVALTEEQAVAQGLERVTFLIAANPGAAPGPLHKVASGGELSRFMLALKVALATQTAQKTGVAPSLVFDEVDSGIGGATASAVGERLAQLAQKTQILVVTHSPQVAARGQTHMRVSKRVTDGQAMTQVEALNDGARREEIARMLAGSRVTDAARQAAESLLGEVA